MRHSIAITCSPGGRGRVGVDVEPVRAEPARERRSDAVQHRVTAGEHADGAGGASSEVVEQRVHRRRPWRAWRGRRGREQLELALRADDLVGGPDRFARSVADAGPAIGTDPDDGDPRGAHAAILTRSGAARHDGLLDRRDEQGVLARPRGEADVPRSEAGERRGRAHRDALRAQRQRPGSPRSASAA